MVRRYAQIPARTRAHKHLPPLFGISIITSREVADMNSRMAGIWVVLVVAALFWLMGFWNQKANNAANSGDYSIKGRGLWTYLLGIRPGVERVYLRSAYLQLLGLVYLVVGLLTVLFHNVKLLRTVTLGVIGMGLLGGTLVWMIADLVARSKH